MNDKDFSYLKSLMNLDTGRLTDTLASFIRDYMEKLDREGIILGLSGGIDSAVVAALCKRAVGAEKVLALVMPERDSSKEHKNDALQFAGALNIRTKLIDISPYLEKFGSYRLTLFNRVPLPRKVRNLLTKKAYSYYQRKTGETPFSASISGFRGRKFASWLKKGNAYYRIKHRTRMALLYLHAELENRLVVGAANKTEYMTGFFVKHGCDDATDIMPIIGLYKTQVRELAAYLGVPLHIREKPPSPDIIADLTDEEAIGLPYETLDFVLLALEKGWSLPVIAGATGISEREVEYVRNLTVQSEHMRRVYAPEIKTNSN